MTRSPAAPQPPACSGLRALQQLIVQHLLLSQGNLLLEELDGLRLALLHVQLLQLRTRSSAASALVLGSCAPAGAGWPAPSSWAHQCCCTAVKAPPGPPAVSAAGLFSFTCTAVSMSCLALRLPSSSWCSILMPSITAFSSPISFWAPGPEFRVALRSSRDFCGPRPASPA